MTLSPTGLPRALRSARPADLPTGFFDALDLHLADRIASFDEVPSPEIWLAVALASRGAATGRGCLRLDEIAGRPLTETLEAARGSADALADPAAGSSDELKAARGSAAEPIGGSLAAPDLEPWLAGLTQSSVVALEGGFRPLVLVGRQILYLHRQWAQESRLAEGLTALAGLGGVSSTGDPEKALVALTRRLTEAASLLGLGSAFKLNFEQERAVLTAATRGLTLIVGGAGTGKTTIVASLLVLLAELAGGGTPAVRLAAPTGKAANRLKEQIDRWLGVLDQDGRVKALLGGEGPSTLYRLLGGRPDSARFRHHAGNPLPADVLIIDESSMVDLSLMTRVVDALKPGARLVLLGDDEQLPPVEVGNVFRDLCGDEVAGSGTRAKPAPGKPAEIPGEGAAASWREGAPSPMPDAVIRLARSMRFAEDSGIAKLAGLIRGGDADAVAAFPFEEFGDIEWHEDLDLENGEDASLLAAPYQDLVEQSRDGTRINDVLGALARYRVLCLRREGRRGVSGLNEKIEEALRRSRHVPAGRRWFPGRPVLVTRNDYAMQLFNGDTGVVVAAAGERPLRVHFEGGSRPGGAAGGLAAADDPAAAPGRDFEPGRLGQVETCWAMTVHKSQGSEFETVALVLPMESSRLLVRELVYTAVTRARRRLVVFGTRERMAEAVRRRLPRPSGLAEQILAKRSGGADTAD